jgi:hypothetical protein
LSIEGFFSLSSREEEMVEEFNEDFDFDFDLNSLSALEEFQ